MPCFLPFSRSYSTALQSDAEKASSSRVASSGVSWQVSYFFLGFLCALVHSGGRHNDSMQSLPVFTSTMLLFTIMEVFNPILFYTVYGIYVMSCESCSHNMPDALAPSSGCRTCSVSQPLGMNDTLYAEMLRPFSYLCSVLLFLAYVIRLWFTLRRHSAVIWNEGESTHARRSSAQREVITSHQRHTADL